MSSLAGGKVLALCEPCTLLPLAFQGALPGPWGLSSYCRYSRGLSTDLGVLSGQLTLLCVLLCPAASSCCGPPACSAQESPGSPSVPDFACSWETLKQQAGPSERTSFDGSPFSRGSRCFPAFQPLVSHVLKTGISSVLLVWGWWWWWFQVGGNLGEKRASGGGVAKSSAAADLSALLPTSPSGSRSPLALPVFSLGLVLDER